MKTFIKGQKSKLADITQSTAIEVSLNISFPVQKVIDYGCFGVDKNNKLSNDRYFIFYNQKQSPNNALELLGSKFGDIECFKIDLTKLPSTINKLVFTATLDDEGVMSEMKQGHLRLFVK